MVSSGDSLWSLATKYDTEVRIIKEINYIESDLLSINDTLLIPLSKMKTNNFIPYEMHIVSEGDTLWDISKKYGIPIKDLIKNKFLIRIILSSTWTAANDWQ